MTSSENEKEDVEQAESEKEEPVAIGKREMPNRTTRGKRYMKIMVLQLKVECTN